MWTTKYISDLRFLQNKELLDYESFEIWIKHLKYVFYNIGTQVQNSSIRGVDSKDHQLIIFV